MSRKLGARLAHISSAFLIVMTLPVCFLSLFGSYVETDFFAYLGQARSMLLLVLASLLVLLTLTFSSLAIDRLSERGLRVLRRSLFLVMLLGMVAILTSFDALDRLDSFYLIDKARYLADNPGKAASINQLYGKYFSYYPNNHLLVAFFATCFRLLDKLGMQDQYRALTVFNAACIYLANVITYRIALKTKGERFAAKALVLLALNPLGYILAEYVYSTTLSIPLLVAILDIGLDVFRSDKRSTKYLGSFLCGILGALSYYIRPTSLMPLVAFVLLAILYVMQHGERLAEVLRLSVTCVIGLALALAVIPLSYDGYFDPDLDGNSFPASHWLMMGSHGDGEYDYADARLTASFETKEQKGEEALKATVRNYRQLGPSGTLRLFVDKVGITFANGYPENKLAQDEVHSALYPYLADDRSELFVVYCQAFRVVTLLLMMTTALVRFADKDAIDPLQLICSFTVMGGFIFYALWEVKTIYGVPFVPCMLLCACPGMSMLAKASTASLGRIGKRGLLREGFALTAIAMGLVSLLLYGCFCQYRYDRTDYAWRRQMSHGYDVGIEELREQGGTFIQELPLDRPINTIELQSYSLQKEEMPSLYRLDLTDTSGNVLGSTEFSSEDEHDWLVDVPMEYAPERPTTVRVALTVLRAGDSPLYFFFRRTAAIDTIPGKAYLNGELFNHNLELSAYRRYQAPYMRTRWYLLLCASLFVLTSVLLYGCWKLGVHRATSD